MYAYGSVCEHGPYIGFRMAARPAFSPTKTTRLALRVPFNTYTHTHTYIEAILLSAASSSFALSLPRCSEKRHIGETTNNNNRARRAKERERESKTTRINYRPPRKGREKRFLSVTAARSFLYMCTRTRERTFCSRLEVYIYMRERSAIASLYIDSTRVLRAEQERVERIPAARVYMCI